ncbi:MAG TPA: HEAT repeat domain-containing protein [Polyangia bacterium]|jgi:HEAT repeat protein|nr:HEAT repeat domain-containing protein [Polyangia bacterium]
MRIQSLALAVILAFAALACEGDPNDPNTWAKQLKNLRTQKEALDHLANMDVEKARPAVPALMALYQDTKRPEHLEALARYKDERSKALFIEALEYSDDDFDRATIAAGVLGEMKSPDAVDPLIKAAEKQLPIKSRANNVRISAIRAMVKIGDKRAVPTLMKILTTSADDQDFLLNQKAALALAEFRDPQSIPALIKGLFMTGRGAGIFQECRLALVRIGAPAVDPLIQLLEEKNPEIQEMAKKLKFEEPPPVGTPGVVPHKAAILLGDLRARKAVPILAARLQKKPRGDEQRSALIALGYIADPPAVEAILGLLRDAKADPASRASAADALYLSGDRRAVPTLFEIARSGYVMTGGQKASDLRASAAIALARIAGKESFEAFKALADKETEAQGVFGMALDRMLVANECDRDLDCYGKKLNDPSWTRAEKAAFALGFSGDAKNAIPLLLASMRPIAAMSAERFPVHQAILFSLSRLGTKDCAACVEKLEKQIERDEKAVRIPGARDLLGETRVTLAIIQNRDTKDVIAARMPAPEDAVLPVASKGGKSKAAKVAKASAKAGKKGKKRK